MILFSIRPLIEKNHRQAKNSFPPCAIQTRSSVNMKLYRCNIEIPPKTPRLSAFLLVPDAQQPPGAGIIESRATPQIPHSSFSRRLYRGARRHRIPSGAGENETLLR